VSTRHDPHGESQIPGLSRDLFGTIGLALGGQGLAAGCVLAVAGFDAWIAWSLVVVMVVGGLVLSVNTRTSRPQT
jgi:hypothetical protein